MRLHTPDVRTSGAPDAANPALLCALYGGIQFVWGAVLAVSLQARSIALGGHAAVLTYATIAAAGAGVATIVQVAAGVLSDRRYARGGGRGIFYAAGIGLALPAIAWFYLAPALPQLAAAFLALQCALNVAGGPYAAVIPDYVEIRRRGRASSYMSAYSSLGNARGSLSLVSYTSYARSPPSCARDSPLRTRSPRSTFARAAVTQRFAAVAPSFRRTRRAYERSWERCCFPVAL